MITKSADQYYSTGRPSHIMASEDMGRIMSIQSHVAYGYVGGKAATFPLQLLGYDVDVVNTVNFSNHSGYRRFGGTKASAEELDAMFSAMEQNGLLKPTRILTGFVFGAEALSVVARSVTKLLQGDPQIVYLLDPVMGDAGRLYVSPDVIPIYRSLLPKATIITPNWFEAETIADIKIVDRASLQKVLTVLHETYSVPNVVISSIPMTKWLWDATLTNVRSASCDREQSLLCLASVREAPGTVSGPLSAVYTGCVPLVPGYFSGVGDLFSALTPFLRSPMPFQLALTKTHAMLCYTERHAFTLPPEERTVTDDELDEANPERRIRRMCARELRLVQGRKILTEMRKWEGILGFGQ
ncbi:Ribokinase-like protein [Lactarius indigo]|nr:Ribokinase-like protein [Lactarius indigo]